MDKKKHNFLKKPHLDGGKEYLKKHVIENLKYPTLARENNIEGDVVVRYRVTDRGEVHDVEVEHGIGFGCDEEAVRLVKMLRFQAVKNRGVRLTSGGKMKIPFRLPPKFEPRSINLVFTPQAVQPDASSAKPAPKAPQTSYTYTIKLS